MNTRKTGVVLLALLLAGMAMVPLVSATEETPVANPGTARAIHLTKIMDDPEHVASAYPAVQNKDAVIKSLMGKDITVADFYETLYPGVTEKLPSNVQTLYKNTKMTWPSGASSPKKLSPEEADSIVASLKKSTSSGNEVPALSLPTSAAATRSDLSINGLSVAWKGRVTIYQSTTVVDPPVSMTYLSTRSMLWQYQSGSGFQKIAEKLSVGTLISRQVAQGTKAVNPGLFQVLGEHYGIAPIGYWPPSGTSYSTSQYFSVT
jgi:hypothetical protein